MQGVAGGETSDDLIRAGKPLPSLPCVYLHVSIRRRRQILSSAARRIGYHHTPRRTDSQVVYDRLRLVSVSVCYFLQILVSGTTEKPPQKQNRNRKSVWNQFKYFRGSFGTETTQAVRHSLLLFL